MAQSTDQINVGKLHVGPVPSQAIAGLTFGQILPGLVTMKSNVLWNCTIIGFR